MLLLTPLRLALMFVVPAATAVVSPDASMAATLVFEEVQPTVPAISCVLLSLYVPVTVNCWVEPTTIVELAGVIVMEVNVTGAVIVRTATLLVTLLSIAVTLALPAPTADVRPLEPIVATPVFPDIQPTVPVRFCVLASLYVPVAVNC